MTQSIDLGRLRFYFRGAYNNATTYEVNDVVTYGGSSYVYIYATNASGNLPTSTTYWNKIAEGLDNRGAWATATSYFPNDLVSRGGQIYLCLIANTSDTFATDLAASKWELFAGGSRFRSAFATSTAYLTNDIVTSGGNAYIATSDFISNSTSIATDISSNRFELYVQGAAQGEVATQTSNTGALLTTNGTITSWTQDPVIDSIYLDANRASQPDGNFLSGANANTFANSLTYPVAVFQSDDDDYAQIAFRNIGYNANSSTDIIVYTNNGTDDAGWIDMGITSNAFNDPSFTITGEHDGYIFMEAPANTTGDGNLVLATGGNGVANKIVFAAGGLSTDNTQMVITPDENVHIEINTTSVNASTGALTVVGGVGTTGDLNVLGDVTINGSLTVVGGAFETTTLTSTAPILTTGSGAVDDTLDRGFIVEYKDAATSRTFNIGSLSGDGSIGTLRRKSVQGLSKALTNNVATIVSQEVHDLAVGDSVVISAAGAPFDGTKTVASVPDTTTFTFAETSSNVSTTADTDMVIAPQIPSTFVYGDRINIASSNISAFNGNRDFVLSISGNTMTFNAAVTQANTAATGTVTVNTKTKFAGFVRNDADDTWALLANIPTAAVGNTLVAPTNTINFADGNLVYPSITIGGLAFSGTPTISGNPTFSGDPTFSGTVTSNSVLSVTGTLSGNFTANGNPTFSGNPVFSGTPSFTGTPTFTGGVRVQEMIEDIVDVSHTSNVITLNYNDGNVFWLTNSQTANTTINVTNAPTTDGRIFTVNLFITQTATGFLPSTFQIDGSGQTIKWISGVVPTPTSSNSKIDIFSFTVVRRSSVYTVFGSATLNQ